jgi:hypothetical protein
MNSLSKYWLPVISKLRICINLDYADTEGETRKLFLRTCNPNLRMRIVAKNIARTPKFGFLGDSFTYS